MNNEEIIREEFNRKIRKSFLEQHPTCQYCGEKAEHVHHLIPIVVGGDNRKNNLIPLCLKCHGLIHNKHFDNNWKEAQRIGIEKAKKEGKYKGSKKKTINKDIFMYLKEKYLNQKITKTEFARQLNVSRPTLNNILNNEKDYII